MSHIESWVKLFHVTHNEVIYDWGDELYAKTAAILIWQFCDKKFFTFTADIRYMTTYTRTRSWDQVILLLHTNRGQMKVEIRGHIRKFHLSRTKDKRGPQKTMAPQRRSHKIQGGPHKRQGRPHKRKEWPHNSNCFQDLRYWKLTQVLSSAAVVY